MLRFACPYLGDPVEMSEERERHIAEKHPDLLPEHKQRIISTLQAPDQIRRSIWGGNARLFSRWFPDLFGGKHVVVVVVSQTGAPARHWIITAYLTRRLAEGVVEWTRS